MNYWLTEDALVPFLTGVFLTLALLAMAWFSREKIMLYVALVIAAITATIVTTESLIVTDRETATAMVYELADCARRNDVEAMVKHVSPQYPGKIASVRQNMGRYKIDTCNIAGVNSFELSEDGETAQIDFVAWAQGSQQRGDRFKGLANPRVTLDLERTKGGKWVIADYSVMDARSGVSF